MRLVIAITLAGLSTTTLRAEAPLRPPANVKTAPSILNRPVSDLNLDKTSLSDALDVLRDTTSVNMHINWNALQIAGITKDTPVSLQLKNVPLRKALTLLLADASPATWYIDQGVIEITTQDIADKHTYTRVYPVEDLVMVIPDFIGPQFSLQQASQSQQGGSGQSPFQQTNTTTPDPQQARQNKQQRGQDLVTLITSTIRPDIWKSNGGPATIAYYNGMLIVNAPRQVHELISNR